VRKRGKETELPQKFFVDLLSLIHLVVIVLTYENF